MWLQVWSKDGHVDHRVIPQRLPGRGGCLPAGRPALRRGRIRWPIVPEHRGVLWRPEQRVDGGKQAQKNQTQCSALKNIAGLGMLWRDALRSTDYQWFLGCCSLSHYLHEIKLIFFPVLKAVWVDLLDVNLSVCLQEVPLNIGRAGACVVVVKLPWACFELIFFSWQLWKQMRQQQGGQTKQEIKDTPAETCGFSFVSPLTGSFRSFWGSADRATTMNHCFYH